MKKHIRVRRQITEGKRIRDIEEALMESQELKYVDAGSLNFE